MIDWWIHYSAFFCIDGHAVLDRNLRPGLYYLSLTIDPRRSLLCVLHKTFHTQPGLYTARHHFQTPTLIPECPAVRTILWWALVLPDRGANPRTTAWKAGTLTTKGIRPQFVRTETDMVRFDWLLFTYRYWRVKYGSNLSQITCRM